MEIIIDTHLQRDFSIDTIQPILESEFASQLNTNLLGRPSCSSSRDRDISAAPLPAGGSDPDLAGQASAGSRDMPLDLLAIELESKYLHARMLLCDLQKVIKIHLRTLPIKMTSTSRME
jgi:hypothetical protein